MEVIPWGTSEYNEFTVKRPLEYVNSNGNSLGTIPVGTRIRTKSTNNGYSNPYRMYFSHKYNASTDSWINLDTAGNSGAFVNLDMKNGNNKSERALW